MRLTIKSLAVVGAFSLLTGTATMAQDRCRPLTGAARSACNHQEDQARAAANKSAHDADMVQVRELSAANRKTAQDQRAAAKAQKTNSGNSDIFGSSLPKDQ